MKAENEVKILKLCKGKTIAHALQRLEFAEKYCEQHKLALRIKTVTLHIGD